MSSWNVPVPVLLVVRLWWLAVESGWSPPEDDSSWCVEADGVAFEPTDDEWDAWQFMSREISYLINGAADHPSWHPLTRYHPQEMCSNRDYRRHGIRLVVAAVAFLCLAFYSCFSWITTCGMRTTKVFFFFFIVQQSSWFRRRWRITPLHSSAKHFAKFGQDFGFGVNIWHSDFWRSSCSILPK